MSKQGATVGGPDTETRLGFRRMGLLHSWWHTDPVPDLPSLPGFRASPTKDIALLEQLSGIGQREITERLNQGDIPYIASIAGEAAGYGWSAHTHGAIGELGIEFGLPEGNRYLWDFVTLPAWRGKSVYPRLLQWIIEEESTEAERFWIGHDADNTASSKGIQKAGFQVSGEVWIKEEKPFFLPRGAEERAAAGASLFNIPLVPPTARSASR